MFHFTLLKFVLMLTEYVPKIEVRNTLLCILSKLVNSCDSKTIPAAVESNLIHCPQKTKLYRSATESKADTEPKPTPTPLSVLSKYNSCQDRLDFVGSFNT